MEERVKERERQMEEWNDPDINDHTRFRTKIY
jgi:hypothetical protein